MFDRAEVRGRHSRECADPYWDVQNSWQGLDERGRKIPDRAGESIRERWAKTHIWIIIKCYSCQREGVVSARYLSHLLDRSSKTRSTGTSVAEVQQ
jgi:hypothetical protein